MCFFFFKQKTAYEIYQCDWSSDVCSSDLERIFALIDRYCFQGHTHVPGVFTGSLNFFSPDEIDGEYILGEEKVQVNIGSVGQPRDGDRRACYVVLENPKVRFRRVEYDVEKTIAKIHAVPELDDFLGDRLREGR